MFLIYCYILLSSFLTVYFYTLYEIKVRTFNTECSVLQLT